METPTSHPAAGNGNGNGSAVGNGHAAPDALPVEWERLARATAHPLRISILEILGLDGGRTLSPSDLCQELQIPLSNTNYHVTELAKAGLIELVRQRQVRGATEHFYRLPGGAAPTNGVARVEPAREREPEPAFSG
jgi:DNA-binding transcriptional ArsR family regulator